MQQSSITGILFPMDDMQTNIPGLLQIYIVMLDINVMDQRKFRVQVELGLNQFQ